MIQESSHGWIPVSLYTHFRFERFTDEAREFASLMDHLEPPPPTPPPQARPFERIALSSAELPRAAWFWIPLTTGWIALPLWSVPLSAIVVLGGCWRYICLRHLRAAGAQDVMLDFWHRVLAIWCVAGFVLTGVRFAGAIGGLPEPWEEIVGYLWMSWCLMVVLELLVATVWTARGCVSRDSSWAAVLVGAGFAASITAIAVHVLMLRLQLPGKSLLSVLLCSISLLTGVGGPLLVADASARLLQSMSTEQLEEESDPVRRSRDHRARR
jgi:hypothetical protein